jgi:chromate transport protein ChrA
MHSIQRRYRREFFPAMAAYVVVLFLSMYALRAVDATWARAILALLPAVPVVFVARAVLRFVRDSDEMQRRIQLESFAQASLVLTLGSFALGLLVLAGVLHVNAGLALILVLPAYSFLHGVFACITTRRYR